MLYKKLIVSIISFFIWCQAIGQVPYYPPAGGEWEKRPPRAMGLDPGKLQKAVAYAQANEYKGARDLRLAILEAFAHEPYHKLAGPVKPRGGPAGLVVKDGYIVAQWGDVGRVDMTFSVTKSYLSTVAGLAIGQGLIGGVDDPVADYVWDGTFAGAHNGQISWRHLLQQSSHWQGTLFGMHDWADRPPREGGVDEWRRQPIHAPGDNFEYNDVRVNALAYALLHVWRKPLPQVLKERVMDPIGASTTWRWHGYENSWVAIDGLKMQSVSGGGHSGGGMFVNTLDQARFGLLFMRQGQWRGRQVISKEWVAAVRQSSAANPRYGYMWWLATEDGQWKEVPGKLYYAAGFGGNFIVVDEQRGLLVVTRWLDPGKIGELARMVVEAVR